MSVIRTETLTFIPSSSVRQRWSSAEFFGPEGRDSHGSTPGLPTPGRFVPSSDSPAGQRQPVELLSFGSASAGEVLSEDQPQGIKPAAFYIDP